MVVIRKRCLEVGLYGEDGGGSYINVVGKSTTFAVVDFGATY